MTDTATLAPALASLPASPPAGLSPLAITHEALLRHLSAQGAPESNAALAEALGLNAKNFARDFRLLEEAGLIRREPALAVTEAGARALQALDLFAGETIEVTDLATRKPGADQSPSGIPHALIVPDQLNPRAAFDDEALESLAASIHADGLIQPVLVRPAAMMAGHVAPVHRLVAGERRWRAIALLIARGDWPQDRPVPATIREMDDETHLRLALIENLQRRDLSYMEEARAYQRLVTEFNLGTAQIAEQVGFTQRFVQQRLQLLELTEAQQEALSAGTLTLERARQELANRKPPLVLSDEERLTLLEIGHYVLSAGRFWARPPVDHTALASEILKGLSEKNLASAAFWPWQGKIQLSIGYAARLAFNELIGTDDPLAAAFEPALREARGLIEGADVAPYQTAWLNAPHTLEPEQQAEVDDRARQQADREAAETERRRLRTEFQASMATRAAEAGQLALSLTAPETPGLLPTVLAGLQAPLPWKWRPAAEHVEGQLLDATGEEIDLGRADGLEGILPLVMAAMNAAAGLPPEIAPPEAEAEVEAQDDAEADDQDNDDGEGDQ